MLQNHLRASILIVLFIAAVITLLIIPENDSSTWWSELIITKTISAICFYILGRLVKRWDGDNDDNLDIDDYYE